MITSFKDYKFRIFLRDGVPPDTQIRFLDVLAVAHRVGDVKDIPPPSDIWFPTAGFRRGEVCAACSGAVSIDEADPNFGEIHIKMMKTRSTRMSDAQFKELYMGHWNNDNQDK